MLGTKKVQGVSNQCKALTLSFSIVRKFLIWKVGKEKAIQVGIDEIMGYSQYIILPKDMVQWLQLHGHATMDTIVDEDSNSIWRQGWVSAKTFGLPVEGRQAWILDEVWWWKYL